MTAEQLREEILNGTLAAQCAPFITGGAKHLTGEDGLCSAANIVKVLTAKTQRGFVPIEELAAFCCVNGITGGVMGLIEIPIGTEIAPGVTMTMQIKGMLHTVLTLIQLDYRLTEADVDNAAFIAACDGLISLGVMTSQNKTDILALAQNRAAKVPNVTEAEVTAALSL